MSESGESPEIKVESAAPVKTKRRSKRAQSMFFPVLIIALGTFILLTAMDLVSTLNWEAALRLWPLLLIFIGLDLIVRIVPRPGGTILSLIVALAAVGIFGYALLYSEEIPILTEALEQVPELMKTESLSYPLDGVESADILLELSSQASSLSALEDSTNLIEADVYYSGEIIFDASTDDGLASVNLEAVSSEDWTYWINPANWFKDNEDYRWLVALSQDVPISLDLALGSGSAQLELDELDLTALKADGSSGQVEIDLPDGDYDMVYDVGSGAVSMSFPEKGRHNFQVEGGSGKLEIFVPASMEMMVVIEDKGSGRLTLDESQFTQTDIGTDGQGIWVTDGYEDSSNRIDLLLDTGSGSVALLEE